MMSMGEIRLLRESIRVLERKLGILEESEMSCCGLTLAQCHALVEIGRAERVSLVDLADAIGLDTSTMSRTVNNLVTKKMAKRELDPSDRRYVTIQLTPAGDAHFREIESSMESYFQTIYEAIPEQDRAQVLKSLAILLKAIEDSDCC
ncbi:MAG TPA: MarR family winged helix-turn-helix transcriptional regulator [Clostridia bacterium]|nr:MarR family winged helix-turn-helix transcriptional regulator [Clostridia bacterium]